MSTKSTIHTLISQHDELSRLLPLISGITIIEYDGENIEGSKGLYEYLLSNELTNNVVNRIIICGRKTEKLLDNISILRALFPYVEPEVLNKDWRDADFNSLNIYDVLVFHMAGDEITGVAYDNNRLDGKKIREIVMRTRHAYYVCFLLENDALWYYDEEDRYCLRAQLRLSDFDSEKSDETIEPTAFCLEKQEYIQMCSDTLIPKDFFFQCVDEADHGCEECNQCSKYGKRKQCPFAQKIIADCYRRGMYVPKDEKIAHQWEMMASRQGYKPAHIQVADDLLNGCGCNQSATDALEIYREYAQRNDEYCINRIIELAEVSDVKERIVAIPYIAQLAKDGNEDMILKLSDAFQCGEYGLPKDIVQQEEWIRQGADNGNPRFVKAMAEMYEANNDWAEAYQWYKKLAEVSSGAVPNSKLEDIELKMLTNGASDNEIAQKGMDYLYGYHGIERNTHLAYRCLNYSKEKEIPLAIGLLGQMYLKGIEVEKDESTGASLIVDAADKGDLLSKAFMIYDLYDSEHVRFNWVISHTDETSKMEMFHYLEVDFFNAIDDELSKNQDNPIAHYLLGKYSEEEEKAFSEMMTAAELNYPPAQYYLSMMFKDGRGTHPDSSLYREWIEKSANNGYYEAEGVYGVMLYKGSFSKSKAYKFLRNAFEQGYTDSEAEWCLAQCYMNGTGTSKDLDLAYPMYIKAAEEGNADAQVKLCVDYFNGNASLSKNYMECARWGEAAIAQNKNGVRFETAYASSHIGNHDRAKELYLELSNEGNGAAMNNYACELSDYTEKAEWFQKAADAGNDYGMWNLGKFYRDGTGVEKDIDKAIELLTKAANLGCKGAITDIAWIYRYGKGVKINGEEAVKWYRVGVEKGYDDYLLELAQIYLDGTIVEKNIETAIHYYKRAAEKGIERALLKLGELYEDVNGVEVNTHKAIFWYRKAAAKGNEEAKECLKRLGSNWIVDGEIEDYYIDE